MEDQIKQLKVKKSFYHPNNNLSKENPGGQYPEARRKTIIKRDFNKDGQSESEPNFTYKPKIGHREIREIATHISDRFISYSRQEADND